MDPYSREPVATILIASRDRKDELRRALESALRQEGSPEILVMDDGSTDGTAEMLEADFPSVRLVRSEVSRGQCVQRNIGTALASGEIVIGMDDDALFVSKDTVRQTIADFDDDAIGVVAIPFRDHRAVGSWVEQMAPDEAEVWVSNTFVAAAYAVRRDDFLACGGFRESLFRAGEEGELSLRMLSAGLVTRLGSADPMEHHESPRRVRSDILRLEARNEMLIAWCLVPLPFLFGRWLKITGNHLLLGARRRMPVASFRGLIAGLRGAFSSRFRRTAVPIATYRTYRRIRKEGPVRLDAIASELPASEPSEALLRTDPPSGP